jgi:hypothetical protein
MILLIVAIVVTLRLSSNHGQIQDTGQPGVSSTHNNGAVFSDKEWTDVICRYRDSTAKTPRGAANLDSMMIEPHGAEQALTWAERAAFKAAMEQPIVTSPVAIRRDNSARCSVKELDSELTRARQKSRRAITPKPSHDAPLPNDPRNSANRFRTDYMDVIAFRRQAHHSNFQGRVHGAAQEYGLPYSLQPAPSVSPALVQS